MQSDFIPNNQIKTQKNTFSKLQLIHQAQKMMRRQSKNQKQLDEISITSQDNQYYDYNFQLTGLCNYTPDISRLDDIYPDMFLLYPKKLIGLLNEVSDQLHPSPVGKLLNFDLNLAFVYSQLGYKFCKFGPYFHGSLQNKKSLRLLSLYLEMQCVSILCRLSEIVEVLVGMVHLNQDLQWESFKKDSFQQLISNKIIPIRRDQGMPLLKAIDYLILHIAERTRDLNSVEPFIPQNLSQLNLDIFLGDVYNIQKRAKFFFQCKADLIGAQFKKVATQKQFEKSKKYIKVCYSKLISPFMVQNRFSRETMEVVFLLFIAKTYSNTFFFKVLKFIEHKKKKVSQLIKLKPGQPYYEFILHRNVQFRGQLPKIYFLLKKNGFAKLLSYLNETELNNINLQINWFTQANNYLQT